VAADPLESPPFFPLWFSLGLPLPISQFPSLDFSQKREQNKKKKEIGKKKKNKYKRKKGVCVGVFNKMRKRK
jgi:hypothetical protein